MKTVRFSKLVEESGAPVNHLVLTSPEKDRPLQSAAKAGKVLTVLQENVGTKADHVWRSVRAASISSFQKP